jgi:biopolymer transport protein ExbD
MKRRSDETLATPIASLIDVVFLLIIFFVVTASVEKDVVDTTVRLAEAKHVAAVDQKDPRTVTINLKHDGSFNIALQPLNATQLEQILTATRHEIGNAVPVVIRSDGAALYKHVDYVMQAVGRAGLYRVKLSAIATGEGD